MSDSLVPSTVQNTLYELTLLILRINPLAIISTHVCLAIELNFFLKNKHVNSRCSEMYLFSYFKDFRLLL